MPLEGYRREAEAFTSKLGREHYLHFAGLKPTLEIEPIYAAHTGLFTREAVDELRDSGSPALLEFAIEGLIGRATTVQTAELADREATLELAADGRRVPFRRVPIEQAAEPDQGRRAELEDARLDATERELNPLHEAVVERTHGLARELGWPSMTAMCSDISGIDVRALARAAEELLAATEEVYDRVASPLIHTEVGVERLLRSDLPAFFRAPSLDRHFPTEPLVDTLAATLSGLGIEAWGHVTLDAESRPTKSPRAFCAAVRVPQEVYLVVSPHGGRDDYEAILHEAGHSQHFAHARADLDFERRHLGDNSLTEAYAFLIQRLASEPAWLERHLAVDDPGPIVGHSRAAKLTLVRRYAAKLTYEVELHDAPTDARALRPAYARRLSDALRLDWPEASWLSDVDPFFYAARYLRAWALEAELSERLAADLGPEWFLDRGAGARLLSLWREGQPASAGELLGHEPDLSVLTRQLTSAG